MRGACGPILAIALLFAGCANPVNPSFTLTVDDAHTVLAQMKSDPRPLERPLLIVGGYLDPNVSPVFFKSLFHDLSGDTRIISAVIGFCTSFEDCREKIIHAVDAAYPSSDPVWTAEVDVIGASLGGLAARYAAAPSIDPRHTRQLRVARMFTICSPHTGAELARNGGLNSLQADMRPGSAFLKHVASCDAQAAYQLFPYARLRDHIVGERYSAPAGQTPIWLAPPPLEGGHSGAWYDPRILADIARRLRDEPPFSTLPPAPLPQT